MLQFLILLTWLPASALATDSVALISDNATRGAVIKKQIVQIMGR